MSFADDMAALMPAPFVLPDPIRAVVDWSEAHGWIGEYPNWPDAQKRYAALHPLDVHLGSAIELRVLEVLGGLWVAAAWLGDEGPETAGRILPFARVGADGSEAAFWIDDAGRQRIVILGSGSGSVLACLVADDPVDFLRLIAIGYPDVCWPEEWGAPPVEEPGWPVRNEPLRHWVSTAFDVTIPETASELVPAPAEMGQTDTDDEFARWLNGLAGR